MKHELKSGDNKKTAGDFLEKIVLNIGVGRLSGQPSFEEKGFPQISRDLALVSGQKPETRIAKKSIAGFKVREGQIVGAKVTLRRGKMVDFFERLVKIVLPRVKDFRGIDLKNIDNGGTLNLGIKEQFVFPETAPEQSPISFSLEISLVPKRKKRAEAIKKFYELGMPLKKK